MKQLPQFRNSCWQKFAYHGTTAVLLALTFVPLVRSQPVIDQQYLPSANVRGGLITDGGVSAQTFTVGISGQLTQLDLQLGRQSDSVGMLYMEIRRTTASGAPVVDTVAGGWVPGTPDIPRVAIRVIDVKTLPVSIPRTDLPFTSFNLRSSNVKVTAGEVYAIALRSTIQVAEPFTFWNMGDPSYPGGTEYYSSGGGPWELLNHNEHSFRTWVVPEPATATLLVIAMIGLAVGARQRGKGAA